MSLGVALSSTGGGAPKRGLLISGALEGGLWSLTAEGPAVDSVGGGGAPNRGLDNDLLPAGSESSGISLTGISL